MIESTAGTESSAKTMSVVSITTSATKRGVATSRAWSRRQNRFPLTTGLTGMMRAIQVSQTLQALATARRSRCSPKRSLQAAKTMSAVNG